MSGRCSSEQGVAMISVLLFMVVASGVIAAIALSTLTNRERGEARTHRLSGIAPADDAMTRYAHALQADLAREDTGWLIPRTALRNVHSRCGRVYTQDRLPQSFRGAGLNRFDNTSIPRAFRNTVREPVSSTGDDCQAENYGWWQVYSIVRPDFRSAASANVVLYLRAWASDAQMQITTQPRILRVEYRAGRFSDYQLIADGVIEWGEGSTINGPVHSNGRASMYARVVAAGAPRSSAIRTRAPATPARCASGASFSVLASGSDPSRWIDMRNAANCDSTERYPRQLTDQAISLLRTEDSLDMMRRRCNTGIVRCIAGDSRDGMTTVRLSGSTVRAFPGGTFSAANGLALKVSGNVRISGMLTRGRLTVATDRPSWGSRYGNTFGSGTIVLAGDVGVRSLNGTSVVGLMAQGSIITDIDQPCGNAPSQINAAMIAQGGTLSVPTAYLATTRSRGVQPVCDRLNIIGAIAAHYAPLLSINYTTSNQTSIGYQNRTYSYDGRLYYNPPPYFPLTGPWQIVHWKDANVQCLTTRLGDARCR